MARADGDRNSLSALVLIGGGLVVASLTFGGAYLWLGQSASDQLVVIKAPTTPVRVAPEDRGGLKLNSIDSPVMDLLVEQANQDEKNAEVLVPSESEPELPPIEIAPEKPEDNSKETATVETKNSANDEISEETAEAETAQEPATLEPAAPETVVSAEQSTGTASKSNQDDAPAADVKEEKTADQADQPKDEIADAISSLSSDQPAPKPETPKIVTPSDADAPRFVVQFAAFKSETRAKNTAAVLATKHASRLNDITLGYMRRDDYWRVVTEPMPRADATSLCRMFRSVGQDCITKLMEQPQ